MKYSRELIAASTVPLILSILKQGRSYGYLIIKNVMNVSNGDLQWSEAMIYPVLKRMEKDGLIASTWITATNGRRRKYYDITCKGKEYLLESKKEWLSLVAFIDKVWSLES